jgi:hypothetical protein
MFERPTKTRLLSAVLQLFVMGSLLADEPPVKLPPYDASDVLGIYPRIKRVAQGRAALERQLKKFETVEKVNQYFETHKDRLDPIEGYWICTFRDGAEPPVERRCFFVRMNEHRFVNGFILENGAVKFYVNSDIEIEKNDGTYNVVPSEFARVFGWIDLCSPFKVEGDRFAFTSDTRAWNKKDGRVRTHEFTRVELHHPAE